MRLDFERDHCFTRTRQFGRQSDMPARNAHCICPEAPQRDSYGALPTADLEGLRSPPARHCVGLATLNELLVSIVPLRHSYEEKYRRSHTTLFPPFFWSNQEAEGVCPPPPIQFPAQVFFDALPSH